MGDQVPGPLCSSDLGADWIDGGTTCLSRSKAPVSAGTGEPLATPRLERMPGEKEMFAEDIKTIARSPFGLTKNGKEIVSLLQELQKSDKIVYGETHGDPPPRGEWDGTSITVNKDFYANGCKTTVELVHEASHAAWRRHHRLGTGKPESTEAGAENEYYSVKNQLAIYKWLRDVKHCPSDAELERRLEQEESGTLKSAIEGRETTDRERQGQ